MLCRALRASGCRVRTIDLMGNGLHSVMLLVLTSGSIQAARGRYTFCSMAISKSLVTSRSL